MPFRAVFYPKRNPYIPLDVSSTGGNSETILAVFMNSIYSNTNTSECPLPNGQRLTWALLGGFPYLVIYFY